MSSVSSDRYIIRVRVVLFYNGLFEVTELFVKRTQQKTLLL